MKYFPRDLDTLLATGEFTFADLYEFTLNNDGDGSLFSSNDFSSSNFPPHNSSTSPGATTSPFGTADAWLLQRSSTAGAWISTFIGLPIIVPGRISLAWSVYAKAGTGTFFSLYAFVSGQGCEVNFNLSNGTVQGGWPVAYDAQTFGVSATIEPAGSGWYLCTLTATYIADAGSFSIAPFLGCSANGNEMFGPDSIASNVYVYGARVLQLDADKLYYTTADTDIYSTDGTSLVPLDILDPNFWVRTFVSIDGATAPDGSGTAGLMTSISGNPHTGNALNKLPLAQTYTFSCYLKGTSTVGLTMWDENFNNWSELDINLSNGTSSGSVGGSTWSAPSNIIVTPVGGGWYFCSFSAVSDLGTLFWPLITSINSPTYAWRPRVTLAATYTSKGPFFDRVSSQARGHWKAGLDLDTWNVIIAPTVADPVTGDPYPAKIYGQPWLVAARVGALDGATVDIHRVYLPRWPGWNRTATLDPTHLTANRTISIDNLTVTSTSLSVGSSGAELTCRSVLPQSTGKFYAEFVVNNSNANDIGIGIVNASQVQYPPVGGFDDANFGIGLFSNGVDFIGIYLNHVDQGPVFFPMFGPGDVVSMAVDIDNRNIWYRINGGPWNGSFAGNPAANTGGVSFAVVTPPYYAAVGLDGANGVTSGVTANFGASPYVYTAPTGFGNWPNPPMQRLPVDIYGGRMLPNLFSGRVADVEVSRSSANIAIHSFIELLQRPMPRNLYQAGCRFTLFDAGCQLDRATFAVVGIVTSVTNDGRFQTSLTNPNDWFTIGMLTWTTGNNAPLSRGIRDYNKDLGGEIRLIAPMPYLVQAGDQFTAYPGCDKTLATCTNKFNNLLNFGGFPYVPTPESAI